MDNKKIGALIAKLRKENGLTQQQLGDKVGVGSRAVSKWECGITVPDISIINELSEILGISSNELLSGEINKKKETKSIKQEKPTFKKRNIIIITLTLITGLVAILLNKITKTYTYNITAEEYEKYKIEGYITYKNNEATLFIEEFNFVKTEITDLKIKNYRYDIMMAEKYILGYGQTEEDNKSGNTYKSSDIEHSVKNRYIENIKLSAQELINEKMQLILSITDIENNDYKYNIKIMIDKNKS